ncbi:MAG: tetratricopeptide repeat protein, partial [Chitinophagales bacterium]
VLVSLIAYLALVVCGVYRLFKNNKDPWAFGILFFLFTLSLFTNIPFIVGATQADRLIFFASAGICLLIALAIEKLLLRSGEITILMTRKALVLFAVCFVYAVVTVSRNKDWKDDYTLFMTDVTKSPNNTRLYAFAGTELQKKYEEEPDPEKKARINNECVLYLKKSLEIYPGNAQAQAELGTAYLIGEEFDSSILHFKRAIELDPGRISAITNLGSLYSMQHKFGEAIPYFQKSVALEPVDTQSWFNLAISYMQIKKYDSAIYAFNKTIMLNPAYNKYASFVNTAVAYKMMGKTDSAQKYETIAKQYYPGFSLEAIKVK